MNELIKAIAAQTGTSDAESRALLKAVLAGIADTLGREAFVRLDGFGTFEVRVRAPRTYRNPRTGDKIMRPAQHVVAFRPSSLLMERVNSLLSERLGPLEETDEPEG